MRYSSAFQPIIIVILCTLAVPLCLILCLAFTPVRILEIAHAEEDGRIFWIPIRPGNWFTLEYTHSVQLSRITDDFEIDQRYGILLVSTTFSDHGAGLPYNSRLGGTFSVQYDGSFKISGIRRFFPEILLRVGKEYDNVFVFGSQYIDLSKMYGDSLLAIRTRKCSFLRFYTEIKLSQQRAGKAPVELLING